MKLLLERKHLKETYTIGDLSIDNKLYCNVLEDVVRDYNKDGDLSDDGENKVYGKTAIPYGVYDIVLKYSPHFDRIMPYIENVPGFTNIMIHWGNDENDTLGCLIVGLNKVKGKVIESKKTFNELFERMCERESEGIQIEII